MLFCDIPLAGRIEAAECQLVADVAQVLLRNGRDAFVVPLAGGAAIFGGADSPYNKLAGVGFGGPLDPEALAAAEREYAARGVAIRAEVASLADPQVLAALSKRGYELIGFEDVLGRRLDALPLRQDGSVQVRACPPSEYTTYMDVVVSGFMVPDEQGVPGNEHFPRESLESLFADVLQAPGYQYFVASLGANTAGGAAMRVDAGVAQLAGAATLPAYRRQGVQSALLEERLRWAAASGCDLAVVTTLPGSKSQQNVMRKGFERLYTRAVMVKTP